MFFVPFLYQSGMFRCSAGDVFPYTYVRDGVKNNAFQFTDVSGFFRLFSSAVAMGKKLY